MTGADIVKQARMYVGAPFTHHGRSMTTGVDCVGLVVGSRHGAGGALVDFLEYRRSPEAGQIEDHLEGASFCRVDAPEHGCVGAFGTSIGTGARHAAIMANDLGRWTMIHCTSQMPMRVVENGYSGPWPRLAKSWWRFPEVRDER